MIRKRRYFGVAGGGGGGGGAGTANLLNVSFSHAGTADADVQGSTDPIPFNDIANGGTPQRADVVTAASASLPAQWPTTNALRILRQNPAGSGLARATLQFPALSVGSHRYYRMYLCVAYSDLNAPGDSMNQHHPVQNTSIGLFNWHWAKHNAAGKFKLALWWDGPCSIGNDGSGYASGVGPRFSPGNNIMTSDADGTGTLFDTNTVYRIEWHIWLVSTAPDLLGMEVRIYDNTGTLMYPDGNGLTFMSANGNPSLVTDNYLNTFAGIGSGVALSGNLGCGDGVSSGTVAAMRNAEWGTNGGSAHTTSDYHYFGKVGVGDNGWLGA